MAFNINERMMSVDRAIITRNRQMSDLDRIDVYKFKPGMLHYVSEGQKLMLSTEPTKDENGNDKFFTEVLSDVTLDKRLKNYLPLIGGDSNTITGQLVSSINDRAPFKVNSSIVVKNLNSEYLNGVKQSIPSEKNTIVQRDEYGNIYTDAALFINKIKINNDGDGLAISDKEDDKTLAHVKVKSVSLGGKKEATAKIDGTTSYSDSIGRLEFYMDKWKCGIGDNTYEIVTANDYGSGKGIDADTVDGKHVNDSINDDNTLWTAKQITNCFAPNGYGLGQENSPMTPNNDLNSISRSGTYSGNNANNAPKNEVGCYVVDSSNSSNIYSEIAAFDSGHIYRRIKTNSKWSTWEKFVTDKNIIDIGTHVFLSSTTPTTANENAFWYEIVS